jgi:hypothetical protein
VATSITFTDGTGAATLTNGKPVPGDRLAGWMPNRAAAAEHAVSLGTGAVSEFAFREDYLASFALPYIPASSLATLLRFKRWAEAGGTFVVNTGDSSSNSYTCTIQPGTEVSIERPDPGFTEYTLRAVARNASAAVMTCLY